MRWTVRGIQTGMADAVRDLAFESRCTVGTALALCIQHGLPGARRHLAAEQAESTEFNSSLLEIEEIAEGIRMSFTL
jgi:hypothetical protein